MLIFGIHLRTGYKPLIPFSVSAADGVTEDGLCYSVSDEYGEVYITGYEGESSVVTIPNEIEGYPVTIIEKYAFMYKTITEINFPDTLKWIYPYAFKNCFQLKELIFPDSLEIIDDYSFENCDSVEKIFISKSVRYFTSYAFCDGMRDTIITVDSENPYYYSIDNCVISKDNKNFVLAGKCSSVSIPDGIENIGPFAFEGNLGLDVLELPSSVKYIGEAAFANTTLRELILNDGLEYIGGSAFSSSDLESITMPDSVTHIGEAAFDRCNITEINLPAGLTAISEKMFSMCFELKHVVIPEKVESIHKEAFRWCKGLETVVIPKSVKYIDADVFITCDSLKTIYYCGTKEEWDAVSIHSSNRIFVVCEYVPDKNGDLDGDGEISASDSLIMRKYLSKLIVDADINVSLADMNGDGRINAKDQFELRKILAQ